MLSLSHFKLCVHLFSSTRTPFTGILKGTKITIKIKEFFHSEIMSVLGITSSNIYYKLLEVQRKYLM
jgi:hypothetical protein